MFFTCKSKFRSWVDWTQAPVDHNVWLGYQTFTTSLVIPGSASLKCQRIHHLILVISFIANYCFETFHLSSVSSSSHVCLYQLSGSSPVTLLDGTWDSSLADSRAFRSRGIKQASSWDVYVGMVYSAFHCIRLPVVISERCASPLIGTSSAVGCNTDTSRGFGRAHTLQLQQASAPEAQIEIPNWWE